MATTKIFTNTYDSTKSFSVAGALVTWGTGKGASTNMPLYMTSLRWLFGRAVKSIEPINVASDGSFRQLNITGTPVGSITIAAVMVPELSELAKFLEKAGRGCVDEKDQVVLNISPFHKGCANVKLKYILRGFILESATMDLNQGNMAKTLQGSFTDMEIVS